MNFNLTILCLAFISIGTSQLIKAQETDDQQIRQLINNFSKSVMSSDYKGIANAYTEDGKILPPGTEIITGKEAIKKRWTLPEGVQTSYHKITPVEIVILDKTAYDHGYYEGTTKRKDGSEVSWKGKYVIVWKKIDDEWKMYLDIWNPIRTN